MSTSIDSAMIDLPGRLGDPDRSPLTDPRIHPGMLAALQVFGLEGAALPPPVSRADSAETISATVGAGHDGFQAVYDSIDHAIDGDSDDVVETTETIEGVDGNSIQLHVFRPVGVDGPLPGVVYTHGGGMTILSTNNKVHRRWCIDIAQAGCVVVMVDFRNAWTAEGHHPFPAGVNDCLSGVKWAAAHKDQIGMTSLVVQGESGGGNLAIATALLAQQEGCLDLIDGVYANVPYISGGYGWTRERKLAELPSLVENDGYFIETAMMDLLVAVYDPDGSHAEDPIAWPHFATEDDVRGLPPMVISVNELDPLRDEGIAFQRLLTRAGVEVTGRVNLGIVHGAELIFRHGIPAIHAAAIRDIAGFAASRA